MATSSRYIGHGFHETMNSGTGKSSLEFSTKRAETVQDSLPREYNLSKREKTDIIKTKNHSSHSQRKFKSQGDHRRHDCSVRYKGALSRVHRGLGNSSQPKSIFNLITSRPWSLLGLSRYTPGSGANAFLSLTEDLLRSIPPREITYSLFDGFKISLKNLDHCPKRITPDGKSRITSVGVDFKLSKCSEIGPLLVESKSFDSDDMKQRLKVLKLRKSLCTTEIKDIDRSYQLLNASRKAVLSQLAELEKEETALEQLVQESSEKFENLELFDKTDTSIHDNGTFMATNTPNSEIFLKKRPVINKPDESKSNSISHTPDPDSCGVLSGYKRRNNRRASMPVLHEHLDPGTLIKTMKTHDDFITALDFDIPFGTMITAALDDTVKVWDLNLGRCLGYLEGHYSSVRCLQVEDHIVATGSMDASVKVWNLDKVDYSSFSSGMTRKAYENLTRKNDVVDSSTDNESSGDFSDASFVTPPSSSLRECLIYSLEAHVAEITALDFRGDVLVSGSADKTIRQWDLNTGRCIQTLDVLWAAAQASALTGGTGGQWQWVGKTVETTADFVGAVKCFESALACGTADGVVRLWDLRSGQVHRSLIGHTGPVTALQFDDIHIVTGSLDKSVRIWDLRTGNIHDAFAYEMPILNLTLDPRKIVVATGEPEIRVYDKATGRHWSFGSGSGSSIYEGETKESVAEIERVRLKDGFMIEGRKNGYVGVWSC